MLQLVTIIVSYPHCSSERFRDLAVCTPIYKHPFTHSIYENFRLLLVAYTLHFTEK